MFAYLVIGILVVGNLPMILAWTGLSDTGNFSNDLAGNRKYQKLAIKNTLYENLDANINFADQNVINILFFGMDESIERESRYSVFPSRYDHATNGESGYARYSDHFGSA